MTKVQEMIVGNALHIFFVAISGSFIHPRNYLYFDDDHPPPTGS